jgi:hypothetical protein
MPRAAATASEIKSASGKRGCHPGTAIARFRSRPCLSRRTGPATTATSIDCTACTTRATSAVVTLTRGGNSTGGRLTATAPGRTNVGATLARCLPVTSARTTKRRKTGKTRPPSLTSCCPAIVSVR